MSGMLFRRQADPTPLPTPTPPPGFVAEDGRFVPFWYTRTGEIIKWSLFLGFVFIVSVFLLVGYWHAKRRVRQGKIPLGYHRV